MGAIDFFLKSRGQFDPMHPSNGGPVVWKSNSHKETVRAIHYGRFCGFFFILFLTILASKAQNTVDHSYSLEIFEIESKLQL